MTDEKMPSADVGIQHFMTVADLLTLLAALKPTDTLWPNEVRNLAIVRDGVYIGFVSFMDGQPCLSLEGHDDVYPTRRVP